MDIQWLTTEPNPKSSTKGFNAGQVGWKLHAVYGKETQLFSDIGRKKSLCGLRPRHGWSLDLFIEDKCKKCQRAFEKLS